MATLTAQITRENNGSFTVTEVWHDAWRNKTVRHVLGRHHIDVRHARRCAVRAGLLVIDETGLGVNDFGEGA